MNRKKIIIFGITTAFLLIITTFGFAYGYYSSFVRKIDQSKKITVTSGNSQITYIASLTEDNTIETIKPGFTSIDYFAVQNTGGVSAMYFIYLENVINSFINTEDITYSIYRTNGTDNINFDYIDIDTLDYTSWEKIVSDEVYPTKDSLLKDSKETITGKNEYYIYALVINYKYRLDKDQSIDSDHIFGGHVKLIPTDNIDTNNIYEKGTLAYEIINSSILELNGTKYNPNTISNLINDSSQDSLLSIAEDNYGISYYYRGNVLDNYVNFNNMCWKVVRILGDGSIKLSLYDGTSKCNETLKENNSALIKIEDEIIEKLYLNEIKNELNNWYNINNFDNLESKIKLNTWCVGNTNNKYSSSDYTLIENLEIYTVQNRNVFGQFTYVYDVNKRINENIPTLKCKEDDTTYEAYIGLLTAEEVIYNNVGINNTNNNVATLSLSHYESTDNLDYVYTYSLTGVPITTPLSINPVITLTSGIKYVKGNGTINNAYEIN